MPWIDSNHAMPCRGLSCRELAKQIYSVLTLFTKASDAHFTCHLFTGAEKLPKDIDKLKLAGGSHILVGTPGRLLTLLMQTDCKIDARELEVLVLDEADRLLDLGFQEALRSIVRQLPKQRRTALFSATMNDELNSFISVGLRNPIKIVVKVENLNSKEAQRIPSTLHIQYALMEADQKLSHLVQFLNEKKGKKCILYFATCHCVDYFSSILSRLLDAYTGDQIFSLHRKLNATKRTKVYQAFNEAPSALLCCTDLAARGLDFQDIHWVVQFDAPQDPSSFIHRCGRSARLGSKGNALFYLLPNEESFLDLLKLRKIPVHALSTTPAEQGLPPSTESAEQRTLALNRTEIELYQKSIQAFVSYIRFYQEHRAKYIFNFKHLNLSPLTKLFGLLEASEHQNTR